MQNTFKKVWLGGFFCFSGISAMHLEVRVEALDSAATKETFLSQSSDMYSPVRCAKDERMKWRTRAQAKEVARRIKRMRRLEVRDKDERRTPSPRLKKFETEVFIAGPVRMAALREILK